jgi:hypothetical protein
MDVAIRKLSEKNRTLMIYMFNTAYCIMKEELPYTLLFYSMNKKIFSSKTTEPISTKLC